jgi:hypothetical protein
MENNNTPAPEEKSTFFLKIKDIIPVYKKAALLL